MGRLHNFVEKAQNYGAAYILAPDQKTGSLENQGSLSGLAPAQLMNGASLTDAGLVDGAAAVSLDGVNDYIDTQWLTRTNLVKNPLMETNVAEWAGEGLSGGPTRQVFSAVGIPEELGPGVAGFMTCIQASGNSSEDRVYTSIPIGGEGLVAGKTYHGSVFVKMSSATGGAGVRLSLRKYLLGPVQASSITLTHVGEWVRLDFSWVASELEAQRLCVEQVGAGTVTFQATGFLFEESTILDTYFPTSQQMASGECGWAGAANASSSDRGPFARGTRRTFVFLANRDTSTSEDAVLGSELFSTEVTRISFNSLSTTVRWSAEGGVDTIDWANAWPANGTVGMGAVVFDDPGDTVALYVNGTLVSKQADAIQFGNPTGKLLLGRRGANFAPFDGSLLPFAVFTSALTDEKISELFGAALGASRYSQVAVTQQYPPTRLAILVDAPDGTPNRWAEDEARAENIASDIEFSSEIPGGRKDFSCSLARDPQKSYPDLTPYGDIRISLPGGFKVWNGFMDKTPRVSGDQQSITPTGLGYQSVLEDNQAVQIIFIDCDLTKWGDPSTKRQVELFSFYQPRAAESSIGFQQIDTVWGPAIITQISYEEGHPLVELWYFGGGADIGNLRYDFDNISGGLEGVHDITRLYGSDFGAATDIHPDHGNASAHNQSLVAAGSGRKYASVQTFYEGAYAGAGIDKKAYSNLKILGPHGLAEQGIWPNIGFTAKQMIIYLIQKFGSPLTIDENYIDDDGFVITQASYNDPTPLADIAKDIMKYGLYDWFVYTDKRFEYRKPGTYGKFWKAYIESSNLNEVGEDSQRLWRSIVVQYTDVNGNTRTVGPPGSGANVESSELEITDTSHPAVLANRTRRDTLDLKGIGTSSSALAVGKRFLEEANLLNRSGSATLVHYVMDDIGIFYPVSVVKAGDYISFINSSDSSYRKIVNSRYQHNDQTNEIDLDAPPSGLEALLERLQVGLSALGVT